jgi:hypothetical protein
MAIAVQDAGEFDTAVVSLHPEGIGPFLFHPVRSDGIRGEDEENEVGVEAFGNGVDDVGAGGDFVFVQPDVDWVVLRVLLFKEIGQFSDEGFVLAGVAEEDAWHAGPSEFWKLS